MLQVLDIDCNNGKAFFRLGQAYGLLNFYDKAIIYYKKALEVIPNDKNIIIELQRVKQNQKKYLVIERNFYSKMFS